MPDVRMAVIAVALASLLVSCTGHSTRISAQPLPKGTWRKSVALDALVYERGRRLSALPALEFSARRGMGASWDLGMLVGVGRARLSARKRILARGRLALALAPGLAFDFALATNNNTDVLRMAAFTHVVLEARQSAGVSWLVAGKPSVVLATPPTLFAGVVEPARLLLEPGLSVGVRIRLTDGLWLWPEVNVTLPYARSGFEAPLLQAGVGLEF